MTDRRNNLVPILLQGAAIPLRILNPLLLEHHANTIAIAIPMASSTSLVDEIFADLFGVGALKLYREEGGVVRVQFADVDRPLRWWGW